MPTDPEVAAEIAKIFAALESLHDQGLPVARANKVRREVIHFLWEVRTEPKLSHRRPHSRLARTYRESGAQTELTYEHSIPLATIIPRLRRAAGDPEAMLELLTRYVQPVIVLKTEGKKLASAGLNAKLPLNALEDDARARYLACGIEIED